VLHKNILRNYLLLDYLSGAYILTYIAVLANFGINAGMGLFLVDSKVGAVCLAVTAESASGGAIFSLLGRSILGGAGNHLNSLVRNNGDKVLGAGICTITAADAFIGIYLCNAVYNGYCIISANSNALTVTKAAGCAHSLLPKLEFSALLAAFNTHLIKNNCASAIAIAANKCYAALKLGKIMELINNDLLTALNSTGNASNALFIINNSVVIDNRNSSFGTCSFTLTAGNASKTASLSDKFIVLFGGRARNKVSCISWNHADKLLGANSLFGTITAAITLFLVYDNLAVNKLHGTLGAAGNAGTDTNASILALPSFKAHINSLSAGFALCKTLLSGSASGAGYKSNFLYLLRCTIRFHKIPPNVFGKF